MSVLDSGGGFVFKSRLIGGFTEDIVCKKFLSLYITHVNL